MPRPIRPQIEKKDMIIVF